MEGILRLNPFLTDCTVPAVLVMNTFRPLGSTHKCHSCGWMSHVLIQTCYSPMQYSNPEICTMLCLKLGVWECPLHTGLTLSFGATRVFCTASDNLLCHESIHVCCTTLKCSVFDSVPSVWNVTVWPDCLVLGGWGGQCSCHQCPCGKGSAPWGYDQCNVLFKPSLAIAFLSSCHFCEWKLQTVGSSVYGYWVLPQ